MPNISDILSGLGAVAGGVAGGYKDPSLGIEMFLKQRQAQDLQAYREMKLKATLFSKGFDEVTDEDELKGLIKNRAINPVANKSYLDLGGKSFFKLNPERAKTKGKPASAINDMIGKAQELTQYRQAVQNAIAQKAPLTEIKAGVAKGGFKLADFSDLLVPYAGGMNNQLSQPNIPNTKQLFMQNLNNSFMNIVSPKGKIK